MEKKKMIKYGTILLLAFILFVNIQLSFQEKIMDSALEDVLSEFTYNNNHEHNYRSTRSKRGYPLFDKQELGSSLYKKRGLIKTYRDKNIGHVNPGSRKRSYNTLDDASRRFKRVNKNKYTKPTFSHQQHYRKKRAYYKIRKRSYDKVDGEETLNDLLSDRYMGGGHHHRTVRGKRRGYRVLSDKDDQYVHNTVSRKRSSYALEDSTWGDQAHRTVRGKRRGYAKLSEAPGDRHVHNTVRGKRRSYALGDSENLKRIDVHNTITRKRKPQIIYAASDHRWKKPRIGRVQQGLRSTYGKRRIRYKGYRKFDDDERSFKTGHSSNPTRKRSYKPKSDHDNVNPLAQCVNQCKRYFICKAYQGDNNCKEPTRCFCDIISNHNLVDQDDLEIMPKKRNLEKKNVKSTDLPEEDSRCNSGCDKYFICKTEELYYGYNLGCKKPEGCLCRKVLSDSATTFFYGRRRRRFRRSDENIERISFRRGVNLDEFIKLKKKIKKFKKIKNFKKFLKSSDSEVTKSIKRELPVVKEPLDPTPPPPSNSQDEEKKKSCISQCASYYWCTIKNFSSTKCNVPNKCSCKFW
mmetsp:Transcript_1719/g.2525  ORF Transcript_1719/g.2525 Transcript_1719/m.2525 type:complete len:576 (+) Transcript_1719:1544-3271(+)